MKHSNIPIGHCTAFKRTTLLRSALIDMIWHQSPTWRNVLLLLPFYVCLGLLSGLYKIVIVIRRWLYKHAFIKSYRLPVPVVVIGNITVGGVGKTPITKHLARSLYNHYNLKVGIIMRGYQATTKVPMIVTQDCVSSLVGDEALIYARNNIPVAIGSNRYLAGMELLKHYPQLDIILSDDGLQHYRLLRDYEIAILDLSRGMKNNNLLPLGSLREPMSRLKRVNAIILNQATGANRNNGNNKLYNHNTTTSTSSSHHNGEQLINKCQFNLQAFYNPCRNEYINNFKDMQVKFNSLQLTAICAIGNPQRFLSFLEDNGLKLAHSIVFPDHYQFTHADITKIISYANKHNKIILITEKDWVKFDNNMPRNDKIWVVMIDAMIDKEHELAKDILIHCKLQGCIA